MSAEEEKKRKLAALLESLQGRVTRGSTLEGRSGTGASAGPVSSARCLGDFFPEAERVGAPGDPAAAGGGGAERAWWVWKIERSLPLDGSPDRSGARMPGRPEDWPSADPALAAVFSRGADFGGLGLEDLAVFDVECTGLQGMSGVYVFLAGIGYVRGDRFVVEQYFMEDLPGEALLLRTLGERLGAFRGYLSFNGRAFDQPLLQTRAVMNRCPALPDLPHLDLLHPARRLWKNQLPSCGLSSLEHHLFGLRRLSDVPGALIPGIYLDYARGIRQDRIAAVVDHNAQDLASTAALLPYFCGCYREPERADLCNRTSQVGLAGWYQRAGRADAAMECFERGVLACRDPLEEHALSMHVAAEYRRRGRWEDARAVWEERARISGGEALRAAACVEMAKYWEHEAGDFGQAEAWVRRALAPWGGFPLLEEILRSPEQTEPPAGTPLRERGGTDGLLAELVHRLRRLERRQTRTAPRSDGAERG